MAENKCSDCEKDITSSDLADAESALGVIFPEIMKEHYLKFNGGIPENSCWPDEFGKYECCCINRFLPIKYRVRFGDSSDFLLTGITRNLWLNGEFPRNLLPFAIDAGGNYFCLGLHDKAIYYYLMDIWDDKLSAETNLRINARFLTKSFAGFLDGLVPESECF